VVDWPLHFHKDDISTRLPCPDTLYDDSEIPEMPLLDSDYSTMEREQPKLELSGQGYLIQLAAIAGQVSTNIRRIKRPITKAAQDGGSDESFSSAAKQLADWRAALPPALDNTLERLTNSMHGGFCGLFLAIQTLYYVTMMKLHRHVRMQHVPPATLMRNITIARTSAVALLDLFVHFCDLREQHRLPVAFPSYGLIAAVDVLSAGGPVSELTTLVTSLLATMPMFEDRSRPWVMARRQTERLKARIEDLAAVTQADGPPTVGCISPDGKYWKLHQPLETYAGKQCDTFYGLEAPIFFEALGSD
jgi:hypothetical protein